MNGSTLRLRSKPALLLSTLLGGLLLTSCSSAPAPNGSEAVPISMANPSAAATVASAGNASVPVQKTQAAAPVRRSRPQLIRKADIALIVNSLDKSIQAVSAVIKQQQGDLLEFQDQKPSDDTVRHTVTMEIRVPQDQLDATLDQLAQLGTVQSRSITAKDVADQLVDYQARLANLRRTEDTLLKIMDRSGSVSEVLKVAQELSNVRQSIEEIDAQLKSLQNQVAYSTISLKLEAAVAATTPQPPLGSRVHETWDRSTHSVGEFTIGLFRLGIWLMVYSPYLLLLAAAAYGVTRLRRSNSRSLTQTPPPHTD